MILAGIASAESKSITLPGSSDFTWIAGGSALGIATGPESTADMKTFIVATGTDSSEWFGGMGQNQSNLQGGTNDVTIGTGGSFSFTSRPRYSGEYVALKVGLPEDAQSITLNFTADNKVGYSLWSYNSSSDVVTQLIGNTYADGTSSQNSFIGTYTATTSLITDDILFVVWTANLSGNSAGGGTSISVSNISVSYEVPEPATATLSLLALAGLCVRRRRR